MFILDTFEEDPDPLGLDTSAQADDEWTPGGAQVRVTY